MSTIESKKDLSYTVPSTALVPLVDGSGTIAKSVEPKQLIAGTAAFNVADKAEALTHTPVAGQTMYIRSADGRGHIWQAVTGLSGAVSDSVLYCGTRIVNASWGGLLAWDRAYKGHLTAGMFGAAGDGVADDTTAINEAIVAADAKGGGVVTFEAGGTYLCLSVAMKSNVVLDLNKATLEKNAGAAGTHIVDFTGAESATTTTLTANASKGDKDLTVTSIAGFAAGDTVLVYDLTYKYAASGRNQEINRIESASGSVVTLKNRVISDYATASTATITKLDAIENAGIKNGALAITGTDDGGNIFFVYSYGCFVESCLITGMDDDAAVFIQESANILVTGNTIRDGQNQSGGGFAYGARVGDSSHHIKVLSNHFENLRENTFTNNARHCEFSNNTVVSAYDSGINTHGSGCEHILIANNTISGSRTYGVAVGWAGHNMGDEFISVIGNSIRDCGGGAIIAYANTDGTKDNKNILISGNNIKETGLRSATSGAIQSAYSENVVIEGNIVDRGVSNLTTYCIRAIEVDHCLIQNNSCTGASSGFGIGTAGTNTFNVIQGNLIHGISSFNLREQDTSTSLSWINNICDDTSLEVITARRMGNAWGTKLDESYGAATSTADGGAIAHNCVGTPTTITVSGSVASEMVSVTSIGATTFTVAIKKDDGSTGTSQTVYWKSHV